MASPRWQINSSTKLAIFSKSAYAQCASSMVNSGLCREMPSLRKFRLISKTLLNPRPANVLNTTRAYAQIKIETERPVMHAKRLGRGSAGDFARSASYFRKPRSSKKRGSREQSRCVFQTQPGALVGEKIEITLPVAPRCPAIRATFREWPQSFRHQAERAFSVGSPLLVRKHVPRRQGDHIER
jgi:hypothetical protein